MKQGLIAIAALSAIASGGCSSSPSGDDATVKAGTGTVISTGKPQDPQQAAYAAQMEKAGEAMNAQQAKNAAAMEAAKARAGGK